MRQFILGKNVAYASGSDLTSIPDGSVGFFYNNNGVLTVSNDGAGLKGEFMLVLGQSEAKGGPMVIPIHSNNFSFVKSTYVAATKFVNSFVVPTPENKGSYSVMIVKKGLKFNERNKWTSTIYINNTKTSAQNLSDALVKAINEQGTHGVTASNSSSTTITITAKEKGVDYEVIPCDLLTGTKVTKTTAGIPAINDAKMIADMYCKAAADRGIEYTYRDAEVYMYPDYPLNPLANKDAVDVGYTVYTMRFAEPRNVKTRDEVVNQIVQVAFPTGATQLETFDTVINAIVNGGVAAASEETVNV